MSKFVLTDKKAVPMYVCERCNKPVYFAERRTSLGKEWHRQCLRCEECHRILNPGQHAQRRGVPYCHVPCYSALFGPTMFGHGSPVGAHKNFGNQADKKALDSPVKKPCLQLRLNTYNDYYEDVNPNLLVKSKEVNGRLVLEGPLRVHWGVSKPIQLKEKDEVAPKDSREWRQSYCRALANGLDESFLQTLRFDTQSMDNGGETLKRRISYEDLLQTLESASTEEVKIRHKYSTVKERGKRSSKAIRERRVSIINGHLFDAETSVFTPSDGTVTTVTISSLDATNRVIKALLQKFKVLNDPAEYCLCAVKASGERRVLNASDYPLIERVIMGPVEDQAKISIMDRANVQAISEEIAVYVGLPEAVLRGFLHKLQEEEKSEQRLITARYNQHRKKLQSRLNDLVISTRM
ncbi:hypothetical protein CAPTEDRAFT_212368 [Capitella teleta]|uniref:LIM zinc-binding domain-containing protein n=1 Tax=Capitella teleta TaxID=283909 RepID=R7UR94_CAPTE|nr:hypothetical protein CAPTEDRAFT_212368 [Capitella teleta]|eukprot:ELU08705.1 hypothetical protein CAPTEDRAFT_212368 [Capitella teleta]